MPVTKQVIKRVKQANVRYARNRHYSSRMKSMIKLIINYIKGGELKKANDIHSDVVKSIDVAQKKKIIHKNNAAHKKSSVQKALNVLQQNPKAATPKKEEKKVAPKKVAPKKTVETEDLPSKEEVKKED